MPRMVALETDSHVTVIKNDIKNAKTIKRLKGGQWRMKIKMLDWNEEDKEGFKLVKLKQDYPESITPHCKNHGAMNKLPEHNIWRCLAMYGHKELEGHNMPKFLDRTCKACCIEEEEK